MIWTGRYVLALEPAPSAEDLGWTAGRGTTQQALCGDLVLATKAFAKQYSIPLRTFHARFNFAKDTAALFVSRIPKSLLAELTVNGIPVGREMHTLNQHTMRMRLGSLEYVFQYAEFATTDLFSTQRRAYIARRLNGPSMTPFDMPTPAPEIKTMGQWSLSNPLGKGSEGRVFLASNARNEVVAVKVIERNARTVDRINGEIARYREVTDLAKDDDNGQRIVRLKEIIYPGGEANFSSGLVFDQVGLVIEPMAPTTLDSIIRNADVG